MTDEADGSPELTKTGQPRKSSPGHGGAREGAGRKAGVPVGNTSDTYALLAKAKAKRETYRAQMAELEYRARVGELLEAGEVAALWTSQIQIAKGRLLAIPSRLAPVVLGLGDLRAIEAEIREAIHEALDDLSAGRDGEPG